MAILQYLKQEREKHAKHMDAFLKKQAAKYGSLTGDYKKMLSNIHEYTLLGGKWHRPTLAMLAYQVMTGESAEAIRPVAVSLELMHRYLLNHDDLIDRDLRRHGGPTLEQVYADEFRERYPTKTSEFYDKGMGMIAGDIINIYAYQAVLDANLPEKMKLKVVQLINEDLMETTAGWQLQTVQNYQEIEDVSEADFLKGLRLVSAQYSFVWPLRLGQLIAGVEIGEWDEGLEAYGNHVGTAFQIIDDVLAIFGNSEKMGKPVGHDFREGKKSLLVLKAYENGTDSERELVEDKLGNEINEAELEYIQEIMRSTGALDYSKELAQKHARQAQEALETVESKDDEAIERLRELAQFMVEREL